MPKPPKHSPQMSPRSPGRYIMRTPGWTLARVPSRSGDEHVDADEARARVAGKPWAKHARYLGLARGFHLFEYDPALVPSAPTEAA